MSFVGDILGAAIGADATRDAARTQAGATKEGIREQRRQFDLIRDDYAPWRQTGRRALGRLEQQIDAPLNPQTVMSEPGYQFGLEQGQQAIDRKIAAMGGRVSGAAIKAAARYGGDYATTRYGEAYQRRQDRLNRLAALAGVGQTATGQTAQAGMNMANNVSGLLQNQGNNAAGARLAQGSIWGNAITKLASSYPWGNQASGIDRSVFRADDPYRDPNYFGGDWGE